MKIALIGPGIMPIPPPGWGAVEILIWDYYTELTKLGHDVTIINTKNIMEIVNTVNSDYYDFVHLHYDVYYGILPHLKCSKIAITSHYPYIDQINKHKNDGYERVFSFLTNQDIFYNFVLAEKDVRTFLLYGANPKKICKIKNGINSSLFRFSNFPKLDKTIYLGKITPRKNQYKFQHLLNIDFVGNNADPNFKTWFSNYLGEWSREQIHEHLTDYANLLLLSEGEADPLVVKEALIAGLGVVVNKSSAENLDKTLDFITVIEDNKMDDLQYVVNKINENKQISIYKRDFIREYGISQFDISIEVQKYVELIQQL
jgi:glycosyltransferase involved in cell wall biosynthesis